MDENVKALFDIPEEESVKEPEEVKNEDLVVNETDASNEDNEKEKAPEISFGEQYDKDIKAGIESFSKDDIEVTMESILDGILKTDEEGHAKSTIYMQLDRVNHVSEVESFYDIKEEDEEYVASQEVDDCSVDFWTLDGNILNVILKFDSKNSVGYTFTREILDRYRRLHTELINDDDKMAKFSLIIVPESLGGRGVFVAYMPISYFAILDDNGQDVAFHLQFYSNNITAQEIEMTDSEKAELAAEVQPSLNYTVTNGNLFEE